MSLRWTRITFFCHAAEKEGILPQNCPPPTTTTVLPLLKHPVASSTVGHTPAPTAPPLRLHPALSVCQRPTKEFTIIHPPFTAEFGARSSGLWLGSKVNAYLVVRCFTYTGSHCFGSVPFFAEFPFDEQPSPATLKSHCKQQT